MAPWGTRISARPVSRICPGLDPVVTGVNAAGSREMLALEIGDREAQATWGATFAGLTGGLGGVGLACGPGGGPCPALPGRHVAAGPNSLRAQPPDGRPQGPTAGAGAGAAGRAPRARPGDRRHLGGPGPRASCRDRAPGATDLGRWAGGRVGPPGVPGGGARAAAAHPRRGTAERGASAAGAGHPHLPPPRPRPAGGWWPCCWRSTSHGRRGGAT